MNKKAVDIAAGNGEDLLATPIDDFCDFEDEFDLMDESAWFEEHLNENAEQVVLEELLAAQVAKILEVVESYDTVGELTEVSDLLSVGDSRFSEQAMFDIYYDNRNKLTNLSRLVGREVEENELISALAKELVEKQLVSVIVETN